MHWVYHTSIQVPIEQGHQVHSFQAFKTFMVKTYSQWSIGSLTGLGEVLQRRFERPGWRFTPSVLDGLFPWEMPGKLGWCVRASSIVSWKNCPMTGNLFTWSVDFLAAAFNCGPSVLWWPVVEWMLTVFHLLTILNWMSWISWATKSTGSAHFADVTITYYYKMQCHVPSVFPDLKLPLNRRLFMEAALCLLPLTATMTPRKLWTVRVHTMIRLTLITGRGRMFFF